MILEMEILHKWWKSDLSWFGMSWKHEKQVLGRVGMWDAKFGIKNAKPDREGVILSKAEDFRIADAKLKNGHCSNAKLKSFSHC